MDPWRHLVSNIHTLNPPYAPSAALSMYAPMLEAWLEHWPAEQLHVRCLKLSFCSSVCSAMPRKC